MIRSLAIVLIFVSISRAEQFQFHDDFSKYGDGESPEPAWDVTGFAWQAQDEKLLSEEPGKTFAVVHDSPHGKRVGVEATLIVEKAISKDWKVAGVAIYSDGRNNWHLALVESPDTAAEGPRHYIEMHELLNGEWLADITEDTRLPVWAPTNDGTWQYGVPYRLRLELSPEGIRGIVSDLAGKVIWRNGFRFSKGRPAVRTGRPALDNGGFRAIFDDVEATVDDHVSPPPSEAPPSFPPYDRPPMSELKSKATGFSRVEQNDGIWWLIDPNGFALYGVGTDHATYRGHWCQKLGYAPYGRNVRAKYGTEEVWAKETARRLKEWGFNTIAAGHSLSLRHRGLVHTEFISFGSRFSSYSDIAPKVHWTGFPNVFHPRWAAYCDKYARQFCERQKDDPWLLGYFLDNELEWYGKDHTEFGLVHEVFKKPAEHSAKQALIAFVRKRYNSVEDLNAAWKTGYNTFESLAQDTSVPTATTEAVQRDKRDFLRLIAKRYFGVATRAIRKFDPNHLVIGSRFAGRVQDVVWEVAGKHLDVVSCNYYGRVDLEAGTATPTREALTRYAELCKRPMMLTEWSHPALDSGLPCEHGAGQRFDTQTQRARAYKIYQTMLFNLPFMVASHFFMWVDEPALGISDTFPEDTNYGLVNEHDEPYAELTKTAAGVNRLAVQYHSQRTAELSVAIDPASRSDGRLACRWLLTNSGKVGAKCPVEIWEDGKRRKQVCDVPAGKTVSLPVLMDARPGAHFVVARIDPDETLPEADRSDNFAAKHIRLPGEEAAQGAVRVAVGNPTTEAIENVVVRLPLSRAWPNETPSGAVITGVSDTQIVVPQQLSYSPAGHEIAFLVDRLEPFGVAIYQLNRSQAAESVRSEPLSAPFEVSNGVLRLRKYENDGDLIDEVALGDTTLGRVQALIHEDVGQNLWLAANRIVSVKRIAGPVETVLDFVVELRTEAPAETKTEVDRGGKYADQLRRPGAYRAHYRLRVAKGQPMFTVQCLSVKNIDRAPWRLVSYFHYLPSNIGGSVEGDDAPAPGVPNYYGLSSVWFDREVKASYGVIAPPPIRANFWLDPRGGEHPDVYREIERVLKPNEMWSGQETEVWVFGVKGAREDRPWNSIARDLRARLRLLAKLWY